MLKAAEGDDGDMDIDEVEEKLEESRSAWR